MEGWSVPSEVNTDRIMIEAPAAMIQPSLESESITELIVSWSADFYASVYSYDLYWKQDGIFVPYVQTDQFNVAV